MKSFLTTLLAFVLICPYAHADDDIAMSGRKAWSAFQCETYAEMSSLYKEKAPRFFEVGVREIRVFTKALKDKKITSKEINENVPSGVLDVLAGPNEDFVAGRVYQYATQEASDRIMKHDAQGLPLAPEKWNTNDSLVQMIAGNKYTSSNCDMIK